MAHHPPKGHSFQVAHQQRRVTQRRQTTPRIANDENEKNEVMRRNSRAVEAQPGADKQHRRAGRSQNVGRQASQRQE